MIVSCESCKSRYKLDDNKVTGRGAKITCPKCKHVFVVLAPSPAPMELTRSAGPAGKATSDWEDDEPTRIGKEASNLANLAAAMDATGQVNKQQVQIPIKGPATHEVSLPKPSASPPMTKEEVAAKAAVLDFRKVGVTAWKVKVKIGLVYDFSDIRTLRKYISDGRVTSADVISHDGKTWKPLGEIPDLDLFFLEAYDRIEADFLAKGGAKKRDEPSDMAIGNVADAIAAAVAAEDEGAASGGKLTGPVYQDPFESLKAKQRERVQAKRQPVAGPGKKSSSGLWAAVIGLVVVGGAGAWWLGTQTDVPPVAATVKAETAKASKAAAGPSKAEIIEKLKGDADPVPPGDRPPGDRRPVRDAPPELSEAGTEGCERIIEGKCVQAVGPKGGTPPLANTTTAAIIPQTTGLSPALSTSITDDEATGDDAKSHGDWDTALTAYEHAIKTKGKSAKLLYKLGEAQDKVGDPAAAGTLTEAAKMGNARAYLLLAEIAVKAQDTAGAKASYEAYLKLNPNDGEAKKRLAALDG